MKKADFTYLDSYHQAGMASYLAVYLYNSFPFSFLQIDIVAFYILSLVQMIASGLYVSIGVLLLNLRVAAIF